jgi:ribulose-5-phosphate 4-epimerase/fuculose-1-phosphate aldolase
VAVDLDDVKRQVAIANRVMAEVGLATGMTATLGHASMRVPGDPDHFVIKGRGYAIDALAVMRPDDMVVCDLEGYKVDGPPNSTQCFEVKMHSTIYRSRPEIQGVVHAHPRYTVVMGILGQTLVPMCPEGSALVRTPLPVYPHSKIIVTDAEGMEVVETMGNRPAALLFGPGAVTASTTLDGAVIDMLGLEEQARMNYLAYCAAGSNHARIPEELILEGENRPPMTSEPHFVDSMHGHRPEVRGVWAYYADLATRSLDRDLNGRPQR